MGWKESDMTEHTHIFVFVCGFLLPLCTCVCLVDSSRPWTRLSMHTSMSVCVCVCVCICLCLYMSVCACLYFCVCLCVHVHVHLCISVFLCASVSVLVFLCASVCVCVCTHGPNPCTFEPLHGRAPCPSPSGSQWGCGAWWMGARQLGLGE